MAHLSCLPWMRRENYLKLQLVGKIKQQNELISFFLITNPSALRVPTSQFAFIKRKCATILHHDKEISNPATLLHLARYLSLPH